MTDSPQESDWLRCGLTRSALGELDAVLEGSVNADDVQLRVMARHVIARGGKRLRPALLILSGTFGTPDRMKLLRAAAALELTHVASLYHDDVMDRALVRRSGASTNARWGNPQAAFAGTYLFARASHLWASLGSSPNLLASRAAVDLCAGQLHEVERAYDLGTQEPDHLRILEQKTATLFELPCRIGALLADAPDPCADALASYGHALGLAFQLADDALDLTGDTAQIGKAAGNDLREGVYSLAVLRALGSQEVGERLRELLAQVSLDDGDVRDAVHLVRESRAIPGVLGLARSYAVEAREAIASLPVGPALHSLNRLADYAVERSF